MVKPTVVIGEAELYLGDCKDILPYLPKVDACITDPPYGIGAASSSFYGTKKRKNSCAAPTDYGHSEWDRNPPEKELLDAIIGAGKTA